MTKRKSTQEVKIDREYETKIFDERLLLGEKKFSELSEETIDLKLKEAQEQYDRINHVIDLWHREDEHVIISINRFLQLYNSDTLPKQYLWEYMVIVDKQLKCTVEHLWFLEEMHKKLKVENVSDNDSSSDYSDTNSETDTDNEN